jgi:uncharacterized protein YjbI with pentapeptide repeats
MPSRPRRTAYASVDPVALTGLTDGDASDLRAGGFIEALRFAGLDVSGEDLSNTRFSECEFVRLFAHDTNFRGASFVESTLSGLDVPVLRAPRSEFRDVSLADSRLGSCELYDATWSSVIIRDVKIGFANLRGASLSNVIFAGCTIEELDLSGARLDQVSFVNTTIDALDVAAAQLTNTDLRGASLRRISGLTGLRGATLTSLQTAELSDVFAEHLGIVIAEA